MDHDDYPSNARVARMARSPGERRQDVAAAPEAANPSGGCRASGRLAALTGPWIYMLNENSVGEFVRRWAAEPTLTPRRDQAEASCARSNAPEPPVRQRRTPTRTGSRRRIPAAQRLC
jgi:hypothetical protein